MEATSPPLKPQLTAVTRAHHYQVPTEDEDEEEHRRLYEQVVQKVLLTNGQVQ